MISNAGERLVDVRQRQIEWSLKEEVICQIFAEVLFLPNHFCVMKIIIWNSRGATKHNF